MTVLAIQSDWIFFAMFFLMQVGKKRGDCARKEEIAQVEYIVYWIPVIVSFLLFASVIKEWESLQIVILKLEIYRGCPGFSHLSHDLHWERNSVLGQGWDAWIDSMFFLYWDALNMFWSECNVTCSPRSRVRGHLRLYLAYISENEEEQETDSHSSESSQETSNTSTNVGVFLCINIQIYWIFNSFEYSIDLNNH